MPPSKSPSRLEKLRIAYDCCIKLYEFHSRWRWGIFAGFLTSLAAIGFAFGWMYVNAKSGVWVPSLLASIASLIFWSFEDRNRTVIRATTETASRIESALGLNTSSKAEDILGPFGAQSLATGRFSHRLVFNIFYPVCCVLFMVMTFLLARGIIF